MGLGRAVHGMFIPELPVGLLRQLVLYTIDPPNSRYFDEKVIFTHFVHDFYFTGLFDRFSYSKSPYFLLIRLIFSHIGSAAKYKKNTVDTA